MSDTKERLDVLLVEKGLFSSREKARAGIMAGEVYVNNMKVTKAGHIVKKDDLLEFRGNEMPYVSRGGYKLEKAIKKFDIKLNDKVCMDIGASTGGFTDCMLQNGARKVYSIDVGYGQFAWKLRIDPRVVCMERTNIRYVTEEKLGELCDMASIDVSFISLTKVLPTVKGLLKEQGEVLALIKPQFEAGRDKVGKKGVVREKDTHIEVIENIVKFSIKEGFGIIDIEYSPIKGPEGNIEYLLYMKNGGEGVDNFDETIIEKVVNNSHNEL